VPGFVTSSQSRAAAFSEEVGVPGATSLGGLIDSQGEPDVVLVTNANQAHAVPTIEALNRNLHVYCEKPMATTIEDCEAMVAADRSSKGSLQIGFEYIHSTMPRRISELIDDGHFGDVLTASCLDSRGHWWASHPSTPFEEQSRLRRDLGGGIVFHCGIHQLDMLRTYLGDFAEITAYRSVKNAFPFYPEDVPDHVQLMMKTPSGLLGSLEIFHNRAPTFYRHHGFIPNWSEMPGHEFQLSLIGSAGSCLCDFYHGKLHLFRFNHQAKDTEFLRTEDYAPLPGDELHHDMNGFLHRYLKNIEAGRGPLASSEEALATMRLAFAAEESIVSGETVRLN